MRALSASAFQWPSGGYQPGISDALSLSEKMTRMHLQHAADTWTGGVDLTLIPASCAYIHIHSLEHFNTTQRNTTQAAGIRGWQRKTMTGSSIVAHTHRLYSSLPSSNANHHVVPCQSRVTCNVKVAKVRNLGFKVTHSWPNHASCSVQQPKDNGFVAGCASWGLVRELERELEAEMNPQEDQEKARIGMARFRHKCGERKGAVELLECLEREAIMGEDVGKEPVDYNRRAQIFDRSGRVFQALKELNNDVVSQQST